MYTAFSSKKYDCLDPEEKEFAASLNEFKNKVTELEQRLSLIIGHALQESQSPEGFFKVRKFNILSVQCHRSSIFSTHLLRKFM